MAAAAESMTPELRPSLGADPLDPVAAPFGAFALAPRLARIRQMVIGAPGWLRRPLYKGFTHFTKQRGMIIDLEHLGCRRRLMIDENGQDRWVFRRGVHPEEEELRAFDALKGRNLVFVDIGANNGYFACRAARTLGADARILAFEPHPRTFRKLTLHLEMNAARTVEPINLALGAEAGALRLNLSDRSDGKSTLALGQSGGDGESAEVRVAPLLDTLRAREVERIDIMKIDVEGYEDRVLPPFFDAAPRSLWPTRLYLETTYRARRWRRDVLADLLNRGYAIESETSDNVWLALGPAERAAGDPGAPPAATGP